MTRATFVLSGRRFDLDSDIVVALISGTEPEPIREHAVRIDERWYPVRQAFEMVSGVPRSEFTSHTARRHLSTLGFELHGEIAHREVTTRQHPAREAPSTASVRRTRPTSVESEWPLEASVQALVVAALVAEGCSIESVANTATKERGIDIIAWRGGHCIGIEVKGFPSKKYADPRRAAERKKTKPGESLTSPRGQRSRSGRE